MTTPRPDRDRPRLSVDGARKRSGAASALDGIDPKLERVEWLGLLGPDGAGKTTLMGAIADLIPLGEGGIRLVGRVLDGGRNPAA